MKLVILTGMSGAGRSTALKMMEDIGFYCVDNLPIALMEQFVGLVQSHEVDAELVALGVDIRSGRAFAELRDILDRMKADGVQYEILYLDSSDTVLVRRYKETRRSHPLAEGERVEKGIAEERRRLAFLRERADYILDTSRLLTRELKAELEKIFVQNQDYKNLYVTILSFGFKYGIPADADLVFDVRFLPNPFYVAELRNLTGNDTPVSEFVMQFAEAHEFLDKIDALLDFLIPNYIIEGKTQLVVAVGCTGGKHRSVTLATELYKRLSVTPGYGIKLEHRDIDKDAKKSAQ